MGLLKNLFFNAVGGGGGLDGAHNAHLAEVAIKSFSQADKKRVAQKVIEMGIKASGGRATNEQFCDHFNSQNRICQLNVIALALEAMGIHIIKNDSWMHVKNPFALYVDDKDIMVNKVYLSDKYKINVSIGTNPIDIKQWLV